MRPKLSAQKSPGEQIVKDIRRATRKHYSADDKIRIVEQSHLSTRRTLAQIGVPRATFYRWYDQYQTDGPEALEDRVSGRSAT